METYILIATCYGIGCYLSYKLGWSKGGITAANAIVSVIAAHFKMSPDAVKKQLVLMSEKLS
jgi:hypothetical protein